MTPRAVRRPGRYRGSRNGHSHLKRWLGMVVVVALLFFMAVNQHGLLRLWRLQREQVRLEVEIALLRERSNELRQVRTRQDNDMQYIERLARERYRMVKKGEKVFRVIPSENRPAVGNRAQTP